MPRRPGRSSSLLSLLLAALLAALPAALRAQVGATTDILTGRVSRPDGTPVENATVEATSVETRVTRSKRTNARGEYVILFPDGGGQYELVVRAIGYQPTTRAVARVADEDRLVEHFTLGQQPVQLGAVVARARADRPAQQREAGNTERVLTPEQTQRLPIEGSELAELAALAPGVIAIAGSDTTPAGFSIAGQRPGDNNVTLDGVTFGGAQVPQEALRATRVVTNTYDVSRGQFSGGQLASTTRGGTNVPQGSAAYGLRDDALAFGDDTSSFGGGSYTQHQLSGGYGGPLVRNRLFAFGAVNLRQRTDPLQSLVDADAATLGRLGVDPGQADRFLGALGARGLTPRVPGVPDDRESDNLTLLGRVDWVVAEAHTLALRLDGRWGDQGGFRLSPLAVPHNGGRQRTRGGGAMLTLSSRLGDRFINEARAYASGDTRELTSYLAAPDGRVRVSSELAGGVRGVSTLEFGGNPALPQEGGNTSFEATDELSWLVGAGAHRVKLGALVNLQRSRTANATNRFGTFTYNSIEDFEADRPERFTRRLGGGRRSGGDVNAALYLGDSWRRSAALQLTYGVRLERSGVLVRPGYNAAVDTAFGRRTSEIPTDLRLSPRLGFTWTVGAGVRGQPPAAIVRGGVGEFRARPPSGLFANALDATGLPGGEQQLVCVGDAVPTPDWPAYLDDPASIPGACAGDGAGGPVPVGARRSVTVFDPTFAAPRAWRASLGIQRRLRDRLNLGVDASGALGVAQTGLRDRNLDADADFALAAEAGRPVYVPVASIVDSTGATSVFASRRDRRFAQVYEVHSALRSRTAQVTATLGGAVRRNVSFNLSYSWQRVRDQGGGASGGGSFGGPTTAGDPNAPEWSRSDLERRHNVVGTMSWPARPWLELTGVVRAASGQPFTPLVGGDVNGDGARNDRAYVFADAAGDTGVARGMARLLGEAPARVRECLTSQAGRLAGRNSCTGPWQPAVDLQLNFRPAALGLERRLMVSLTAVNSLAGVDQLLHGAAGLRGWGQPGRPDPVLLYVRGFDAAARAYRYEVNERFGDARGARLASRQPFNLALQARYTFGSAPGRPGPAPGAGGAGGARGGRAGAAGAGGASAGGARGANIAGRLGREAPNPFAELLDMRDSLALADSQVVALEALRDTLAARSAAFAAAVQREVDAAGAGGDRAALAVRLRPRLQEAQERLRAALRDAESVLTPEQWARVPARVKEPPGLGGGGRRTGGAGATPVP